MVQRVIPFVARKVGTAAIIESVIARSDVNPKKSEDAWVSMITAGNNHVLVVEFKAQTMGMKPFLVP